jgi:hypothetical protein
MMDIVSVFENKMLRKIFRSQREEEIGGWRKLRGRVSKYITNRHKK